MNDLVLTPDTVIARWSNASLVVHAAGHEGGVTDVGIHRLDANGGSPEFRVTARLAPFAGLFPYGITSVFALPSRPDEIVVVTRDGTERVPVT
ncbi:MAG TPA: hypothetical protein VEV43_11080 [Actinomycetota bacterium]|nr:hypothetical protein [Actinomycetota bacterium]